MPTWLINAKAPLALRWVIESRKIFARDEEIDAEERQALIDVMINSEQIYTADETMIMEMAKTKFEALEEGESKWEEVESPDHFVSMQKIFEEGSFIAVGRAVTVVDASVEECCSWDCLKTSREVLKEHVAFGGLERDVLTINDHHTILRVCYAFGIYGFLPRDFVNQASWFREEAGTFAEVFYSPTTHDNFPRNSRSRSRYLDNSHLIPSSWNRRRRTGTSDESHIYFAS